jgi:HAD superfamily hydrolase (TIGR01509 family)
VFDVDGTLVDSERDGHRVAFNLAFEALDLPYRWDVELYGKLLRTTGGQRRLHQYLEGEGVPEDERNALVPELHRRKTELMGELVDRGAVEVRPGARRLLDELAGDDVRLAVATTGSRGWVERLLDRLLPGVGFDVIVTGDEVEARKPDPEAFNLALERLDLTSHQVVVVEDSEEGLQAARAAELATVVVVNGYTSDHDLEGASLVSDGFGEPDAPASVLRDPFGLADDGVLRGETLRRVLAAEGEPDRG